eukprot:353839-Chlamydomonas_euryale.AAC.27
MMSFGREEGRALPLRSSHVFLQMLGLRVFAEAPIVLHVCDPYCMWNLSNAGLLTLHDGLGRYCFDFADSVVVALHAFCPPHHSYRGHNCALDTTAPSVRQAVAAQEKLKYQIMHLKRALVEADEKAAAKA